MDLQLPRLFFNSARYHTNLLCYRAIDSSILREIFLSNSMIVQQTGKVPHIHKESAYLEE